MRRLKTLSISAAVAVLASATMVQANPATSVVNKALVHPLEQPKAATSGPKKATAIHQRKSHRTRRQGPPAPIARVVAANRSALQEPTPESYLNALQIYAFSEGAVYRLYAAPEKVSDITLQPGEQLIAISAGDTGRWVIGDTYSGAGEARRVHILVKPFAAGLKTNLVITTSQRAYHLQLESTRATAMSAIAWRYPEDLITVKAAAIMPQAPAPVPAASAASDVRFRYAITGDKPRWRPEHVFDDGHKVYIEFPQDFAETDAPPLFIIGDKGEAQIVNFRVEGRRYIVDRLFDVAELRLGTKRQSVVRLTRTEPKATSKALAMGGGHD